mmetsp:Transcript_10780/g.44926  ORF Transcript_10780/g.44926 Transcript_10780/m.44926 type:complete len:255 (-) Transcript_10780:649-1413(-)
MHRADFCFCTIGLFTLQLLPRWHLLIVVFVIRHRLPHIGWVVVPSKHWFFLGLSVEVLKLCSRRGLQMLHRHRIRWDVSYKSWSVRIGLRRRRHPVVYLHIPLSLWSRLLNLLRKLWGQTVLAANARYRRFRQRLLCSQNRSHHARGPLISFILSPPLKFIFDCALSHTRLLRRLCRYHRKAWCETDVRPRRRQNLMAKHLNIRSHSYSRTHYYQLWRHLRSIVRLLHWKTVRPPDRRCLHPSTRAHQGPYSAA